MKNLEARRAGYAPSGLKKKENKLRSVLLQIFKSFFFYCNRSSTVLRSLLHSFSDFIVSRLSSNYSNIHPFHKRARSSLFMSTNRYLVSLKFEIEKRPGKTVKHRPQLYQRWFVVTSFFFRRVHFRIFFSFCFLFCASAHPSSLVTRLTTITACRVDWKKKIQFSIWTILKS